MVKPVIFMLGVSALPLAKQLKTALDGENHAPDCVDGGDVTYPRATAHLAELFKSGRSIIGLCASGILIRAIAPHLGDKRNEPAIVAVAEDGRSAVPLLGGTKRATTFYRQHGDLFGWACVALTMLALVASRKKSRGGPARWH